MPIASDGSVDPSILARYETDPHRFFKLIGAKMTYMARDCIRAELPLHDDVSNRGGTLHGGAIMAIADHIGAVATMLNAPPGFGTTTIESKTNFFAAVPPGDTAMAECTPLHRGRTTQVWQTKITRGDGKLAALIVQTQMIIARDV